MSILVTGIRTLCSRCDGDFRSGDSEAESTTSGDIDRHPMWLDGHVSGETSGSTATLRQNSATSEIGLAIGEKQLESEEAIDAVS